MLDRPCGRSSRYRRPRSGIGAGAFDFEEERPGADRSNPPPVETGGARSMIPRYIALRPHRALMWAFGKPRRNNDSGSPSARSAGDRFWVMMLKTALAGLPQFRSSGSSRSRFSDYELGLASLAPRIAELEDIRRVTGTRIVRDAPCCVLRTRVGCYLKVKVPVHRIWPMRRQVRTQAS